ncbi:MAG: primosomal protein N'' [Bacteroidetes bacterium]|nr:MAG: primosomal protein N'' [Bacteroidota bacterium]
MTQTERITLFADVLVPLPVPGLFTYRIPYEMNSIIRTGQRVIVQFGKKKIFAAIVRKLHEQIPSDYTPKYILGILDEKAIVNESQLHFWDWIHHYYMCYPGEVMAAALPGALKLASESKIVLNDQYTFDTQILSDNEFLITEALSIQSQLSIGEISQIVGFQKVMPLIKTMIEKKIIVMEEELQEKYRVKTERVASINELYRDEDQLRQLMDSLSKRAYKQLEILMVYLRETRFPQGDPINVPLKKLLEGAGASSSQFKALTDKQVFVVSEQTVSRLQTYTATHDPAKIILTSHQQEALQSIQQQLINKDVVLLHGVTSSGKTELYIKLIASYLSQGKQILYLLPEIALTTQIIGRLKAYFGKKIGVYHSRYNPNEKVEVWNKVLDFQKDADNEHQIILGPRSALFLPFSDLGLIIVDEEHDSSFKQNEPAPRYQARDAAIVLAQMSGAKVLLGSATPSFESYFNAKAEKFGLTTLSERFGGIQMPDIQIVNMREEKKRKTLQAHFSSVLLQEIKQAVAAKEQVILFQNRRGFSLRLECEHCNWVPECRNCDVSLIYHKKQNMLRCHYCGYAIAVPSNCPTCNSTGIKMHGFGTEKVEEELGIILPELKIARLDLDTTRSKYAFQEIIESFSNGKSNVLVGTQMVTKGLDFDKVSVVGVLNADNMLSYPDFRAFERSFQLMAQVSGRSGRKNKRGKVIIQTYQPKHQMMNYVLTNDYKKLFLHQMSERKKFNYPPYYRIIMIQLLHRDNHLVNLAAYDLAKMLKTNPNYDLLGPEYPIISRIKSLYIKQIIIKFARSQNAAEIKKMVADHIYNLQTTENYKSVRVHIDVDPQ